MENQELVELLAATEHAQWAAWMKYLFSKGRRLVSGDFMIPKELVERWQRQVDLPYNELTEEEKESDRREVRKSLEVIGKFTERQQCNTIAMPVAAKHK